MKVAVLAETAEGERRVAATPETVRKMRALGAIVAVETGAGLGATIGDDAFFAGAQLWLERFDDGTAGTADFETVFEEASGQDLTAFFQVWVQEPVRPTSW